MLRRRRGLLLRPGHALASGAGSIAIADIDGDGTDDLVLGMQSADGIVPITAAVAVVPSGGDGTLTCIAEYPIAKPAFALFTDDLDGDGAIDIATASGEDTITLLLSSG